MISTHLALCEYMGRSSQKNTNPYKEVSIMKKVSFVIFIGILSIMFTSCSQSSAEREETSLTADELEQKNMDSTNSSKTDNNNFVDGEESQSIKPGEESEQPKNQNAAENQFNENSRTNSDTASEAELEEKNSTMNNPESSNEELDVESYLNDHYAMENTHFITDSWESTDTGRTNYTVKILPDNKEFGQEISEIFKNGTPYEDKRTETMFDMAQRIMEELPELDYDIHIDSVNWVAADDDFHVMLIQDYENS